METKLKDVLHLYLQVKQHQVGVMVQTNYRKTTGSGKPMEKCIGKLVDYDLLMSDNYGVQFDFHGPFSTTQIPLSDIKPILRPLSSIKESEIIQLMNLSVGDVNVFRVDNPNTHKFSATQFVYLLQQGFDIFGLIESGQAIADINNAKK